MFYSEIKAGDILIADGSIPCLKLGEECEVKERYDYTYVECRKGMHFLDGEMDNNGHVRGFAKKEQSND